MHDVIRSRFCISHLTRDRHVDGGTDLEEHRDATIQKLRCTGVAKVYPQVTNGTFKTDLYFDGPAPGGIHVGQAIDLKVELGGASRAIMLPNGPFYQDTGGNWVFALDPNGRYAMRRTVRLGRRNPDFVEVVDGLKPGEKAIVSGYEAFQKMDRVEFGGSGENQ